MGQPQRLARSVSRELVACALGAVLFATAACAAPVMPSAAAVGRQVDVLDYVLGDAALWPRRGGQAQNQIVDRSRQEVCWTKYANPQRFECWRWNDQYVFHAVDHALDGNTSDSYMFTNGRWLPRFVPASATAASPWTLDVGDNSVVWFDGTCNVVPSRSHIFPYRLRAWIEPQVDGGGDIGVRQTLLFEYEPYDPANPTGPVTPERYHFARGAGWYRWERVGSVVLFNRLGGPPTQMN